MRFVDCIVLSINNFLRTSERIACAEGLLEGHQLVHDAAERPYVRFFGVGLRLHNLGTRIQDCTDKTLHDTSRLCTPTLSKTKVCQL